MRVPRLQIKFSLTIGEREARDADDVTIDLVGTHRDIPAATYDNGFMPNDDDRRTR